MIADREHRYRDLPRAHWASVNVEPFLEAPGTRISRTLKQPIRHIQGADTAGHTIVYTRGDVKVGIPVVYPSKYGEFDGNTFVDTYKYDPAHYFYMEFFPTDRDYPMGYLLVSTFLEHFRDVIASRNARTIFQYQLWDSSHGLVRRIIRIIFSKFGAEYKRALDQFLGNHGVSLREFENSLVANFSDYLRLVYFDAIVSTFWFSTTVWDSSHRDQISINALYDWLMGDLGITNSTKYFFTSDAGKGLGSVSALEYKQGMLLLRDWYWDFIIPNLQDMDLENQGGQANAQVQQGDVQQGDGNRREMFEENLQDGDQVAANLRAGVNAALQQEVREPRRSNRARHANQRYAPDAVRGPVQQQLNFQAPPQRNVNVAAPLMNQGGGVMNELFDDNGQLRGGAASPDIEQSAAGEPQGDAGHQQGNDVRGLWGAVGAERRFQDLDAMSAMTGGTAAQITPDVIRRLADSDPNFLWLHQKRKISRPFINADGLINWSKDMSADDIEAVHQFVANSKAVKAQMIMAEGVLFDGITAEARRRALLATMFTGNNPAGTAINDVMNIIGPERVFAKFCTLVNLPYAENARVTSVSQMMSLLLNFGVATSTIIKATGKFLDWWSTSKADFKRANLAGIRQNLKSAAWERVADGNGFQRLQGPSGAGVAPVTKGVPASTAARVLDTEFKGVSTNLPILQPVRQFASIVDSVSAIVDNDLFKQKELMLNYRVQTVLDALNSIRAKLKTDSLVRKPVEIVVQRSAAFPLGTCGQLQSLNVLNDELGSIWPVNIKVKVTDKNWRGGKGFGIYLVSRTDTAARIMPHPTRSLLVGVNALQASANGASVTPFALFGSQRKASYEINLAPYYGYVDTMFAPIKVPASSNQYLDERVGHAAGGAITTTVDTSSASRSMRAIADATELSKFSVNLVGRNFLAELGVSVYNSANTLARTLAAFMNSTWPVENTTQTVTGRDVLTRYVNFDAYIARVPLIVGIRRVIYKLSLKASGVAYVPTTVDDARAYMLSQGILEPEVGQVLQRIADQADPVPGQAPALVIRPLHPTFPEAVVLKNKYDQAKNVVLTAFADVMRSIENVSAIMSSSLTLGQDYEDSLNQLSGAYHEVYDNFVTGRVIDAPMLLRFKTAAEAYTERCNALGLSRLSANVQRPLRLTGGGFGNTVVVNADDLATKLKSRLNEIATAVIAARNYEDHLYMYFPQGCDQGINNVGGAVPMKFWVEGFSNKEDWIKYIQLMNWIRAQNYSTKQEREKINKNRITKYLTQDTKDLKKLVHLFGGQPADYLDRRS